MSVRSIRCPFSTRILEKLLEIGEGAEIRQSKRVVRKRFTAKSNDYWRLGYDARQLFHHYMQEAADAGAVVLKWSGYIGGDRTLDYVDLVSVNALVSYLGKPSRGDRAADAERSMAKWAGFPRVDEVLQAWRNLKSVRSMWAESAPIFVDALKVIDYLERREGDHVVRQVSVALFRDSKHIEESLTRPLDVLTAESIDAPARHWQEVFDSLGLHKEPQPFLISGTGLIRLSDTTECPIVRPFIGLSNRAITGYKGSPNWLLTIENLTTFHLAAQKLEPASKGMILYSGGMPSPAWRAAYKAILKELPLTSELLHWGDFDEGGFRIARTICACASELGRKVNPWLMSPEDTNVSSPIPCKRTVSEAMARIASAAGWHDLAEKIEGQSFTVTAEQEGLAVILPEG